MLEQYGNSPRSGDNKKQLILHRTICCGSKNRGIPRGGCILELYVYRTDEMGPKRTDKYRDVSQGILLLLCIIVH